MRKRIDRFIEDALIEFSDWYLSAEWYGKERDCVNMYAFNFLAKNVEIGAAISELGQIRIESAVPQPKGFKNKTAPKDLVIWKNSFDTVWDNEWNISKYPRVVMEWKTKRSGRYPIQFDQHDIDWLTKYTSQYSNTFGYLVCVYDGLKGRSVDWAKIRKGKVCIANRRS